MPNLERTRRMSMRKITRPELEQGTLRYWSKTTNIMSYLDKTLNLIKNVFSGRKSVALGGV